MTFTLLAKAAMAIERGQVRLRYDIEEEQSGLTEDEKDGDMESLAHQQPVK